MDLSLRNGSLGLDWVYELFSFNLFFFNPPLGKKGVLKTYHIHSFGLGDMRKASVQFSSLQSLSPVRLFVTPWIIACQASCPSSTPRVHSNSCPSSQWCHPAISSSVIPFSSCPQSLPASGSFPMSQLFAWGGQSIGVSASASVLPMNTQDWSPLGWTGWVFLQSKDV